MRKIRYLVLWAVLTVLATSVGVLAISIVGEQIRARSVTDLLEAAPVSATTLPTPAATTVPPAPRPQVVTSGGGVVTVLCAGDVAQLVSVVANPGWQTLGPTEANRAVQVSFSDASAVEDVRVSCTAGVAVTATAVRAAEPPPSASPQTDPGPASTPTTPPLPSPSSQPEEDGGGSGDAGGGGDEEDGSGDSSEGDENDEGDGEEGEG